MSKIKDMKPGDMFRMEVGGRTCTVAEYGDTGILIIQSLVDGWTARLDNAYFAEQECELIDLPKTPYEWVEFIRRYQIQPEPEYED